MNFYLIIFMHWLCDFVFQTDKMAINKSTSWKWLSIHVAAYTVPMMIFGWQFAVINGAAHFVTDAVTSRVTSCLWRRGDRHNFFVVIGLDQALHMVFLLKTYEALILKGA